MLALASRRYESHAIQKIFLLSMPFISPHHSRGSLCALGCYSEGAHSQRTGGGGPRAWDSYSPRAGACAREFF